MVGGPQTRMEGDELTNWAGSTVTTPDEWSQRVVDTQIGDMFRITKHIDSHIVGRIFTVNDLDFGGQWDVMRQHNVTAVQPTETWTYVDEPGVVPW